MSSISLGASPRVQSRLQYSRSAKFTPEQIITYQQVGMASGAYIVWMNPSAKAGLKVIDIRERHGTAGSGTYRLKIQDASSLVAVGSADSGILIYPVAVLTATGTNVWTRIGSGITLSASPGTDASGRAVNAQVIGPGDSLIVDVPATIAGIFMQIVGVWV